MTDKIIKFGLLVAASVMMTGGILSIINGTCDYPAFRLTTNFVIYGLIIKLK